VHPQHPVPGGGGDVVEGQDGFDTMQFNGANVNEQMDLSANGQRLRFFRDVGNVTMDVNGTEQVNVAALGGADSITVNNLAGTNVSTVNIDLAATPRGSSGDGQSDRVVVAGTNSADVIGASGDAVVTTVNTGATALAGVSATAMVGVTGSNDATTSGRCGTVGTVLAEAVVMRR